MSRVQCGFRLCISDDLGFEICRRRIFICDRLSAILNSKWRSFTVQAMVRPKSSFSNFGLNMHLVERKFHADQF